MQFQDPYGPDSPDVWYARHQQVEWELLLGGQPPVSVFTHHPDRQALHMYWTGDNGCECGSFLQNGPAVAGKYTRVYGATMVGDGRPRARTPTVR